MDLTNRIAKALQLLEQKHYNQTVMEAGGILEQILKQLYADALPKLTPAEQKKLTDEAEKIGKGKSVTDFTLGQLAGLCRDGSLLQKAGKALKRNLTHLEGANFPLFVEVRNKTTHVGEEVSEDEAQLFAAQVRVFAREAGYLSPPAVESKPSPAKSRLRPWTELVKLHPDVEAGALTEAVFAIDLGAITANDPNLPLVYRDAEAFFRATYPTADLQRLLEEVLSSLAGKPGFNRVLKLRTPFGGGKSHTLATLLHAARARTALLKAAEVWNRQALSQSATVAKLALLPDPGEIAVAVFDGEKFDARDGKALPNGQQIQTMWGWLAYQLGEDKYALVAGHDHDRIAPGGDVIRQLLAGKPKLFLLDEVLKYMERAAGVAVLDSTLQRQSKDFFHNMTVEIANSTNAAMLYSLQWSAREAMGNIALLQELDKLASRVDQMREPVSGDEVLPVLQRRLLAEPPDETVAAEIVKVYQETVTNMQRAHAETESERRLAEDEGIRLRDRLRTAYPFHPGLIDLMRERWAAIDNFQRTRGALRFLASCLYSLKRKGNAQPLLGPSEIPLHDVEVRVKLLKELGLQNEYDAVITADIEGPNARAKRIDDRLSREMPALSSVRPATRIATAVFMYSFGGLRREGDKEGETLPPGVGEAELLAACVGPELDHITANAVLAELRNTCLFLHYDGVRYCFKKDPNVTKLIEDAEQEVARHPEEVRDRIRQMLNQRLAGHHHAIIWPEKSLDVPDAEPAFLLAYLPLEFAGESKAEQQRIGKELLLQYGDKYRRYRNGLGLAIPDRKQIEILWQAVRYLLAIERIEGRKKQFRLLKDQDDQLKERRRTEESKADTALRGLYSAVWLLRLESGETNVDPVESAGRPLQASGIHERLLELLEFVHRRLFSSITPAKISEVFKLGEGEPTVLGIRTKEIVDGFYSFLDATRIISSLSIRKAIARGVQQGTFGYVAGSAPQLGEDGKYQTTSDKVRFNGIVAEDEIDLETGFLIMPQALPQPVGEFIQPSGSAYETAIPTAPGRIGEGAVPSLVSSSSDGQKVLEFFFTANRNQLFTAWNAIANLADMAGKVSVKIHAESEAGFDRRKLQNGVIEPLREADLIE